MGQQKKHIPDIETLLYMVAGLQELTGDKGNELPEEVLNTVRAAAAKPDYTGLLRHTENDTNKKETY